MLAVVVRRVTITVLDRGDSDRHTGRVVGRLASVVVVVAGTVYALELAGLQVGPMLGALGIGGIALAFAAQDILSNFVAGILLQVRRPFRVGDEIASGFVEVCRATGLPVCLVLRREKAEAELRLPVPFEGPGHGGQVVAQKGFDGRRATLEDGFGFEDV